MEDLPLPVAQNLKRLREEQRLSLDRLAELSGVSKSMLGQIERGESSPTIATLWKIARGLKVTFTALLEAPRSPARLVRRAALRPLVEDEGRYRLYPYFPVEDERRSEIYAVEIDPGGSLSAEAHPEGTEEFLTVFAGTLTLSAGGEEFRAAAGDALQFRADQPHAYRNEGSEVVRLSMVIHYKVQ